MTASVSGIDNTISQLAGTRLWGRSLNLVIGFPNDPALDIKAVFNESNSSGLDISGLDVDFVVEKSLKPTEPNTCQIKVRNLSPDSRQAISGAHALTVRLEAGYIGGLSQLYFAEARSAWTTAEGPTYTTHIESTDTIARPTGVRKTTKIQPGSQTGSLYRTMGARVPLKTAFQALAGVLGVGEGNLEQALANLRGVSVTAVNGSALVGNGARRMTDLCRSAGLEWSVQDGVLQLLNVGKALETTKAIELSSSEGMEGSPSVDSQGAVTVKTRLIPGLAPGVLIKMASIFVQGGYRVEKCRYVGSTRGTEWSCEFDAVRY